MSIMDDDGVSNPSNNETFEDVIAARVVAPLAVQGRCCRGRCSGRLLGRRRAVAHGAGRG